MNQGIRISSFVLRHIITQIEAEKRKKGTMFAIKTIKRTNKKERMFAGRLNVNKFNKGGSLGYSSEDHDLLHIWEFGHKPRQVNCRNILYMKVCGIVLIKDGRKTPAFDRYEKIAKVVKRLRNK